MGEQAFSVSGGSSLPHPTLHLVTVYATFIFTRPSMSSCCYGKGESTFYQITTPWRSIGDLEYCMCRSM